MNWHFAPAEKVVMRLSQFIGVHNPDLNLHSYDIKNIMEFDFVSTKVIFITNDESLSLKNKGNYGFSLKFLLCIF